MNWYYAHEQQQKGPVDEQTLAGLITGGIINSSSLVWNNSMPNWQPLSQAAPQLAALVASGSSQSFTPQIPDFASINTPRVDIAGQNLSVTEKDVHIQRLREGVSSQLFGNLNYAGFWIRLGALMIDSLIFMITLLLIGGIMVGLLSLMGLFSFERIDSDDQMQSLVVVAFLILFYAIAFFGPIAYNAILIGKRGATWGKSALGLKVVTAQGTPVSKGRAWGRAFAFILNNFCGFMLLTIAFDKEKRGIHDMICETRVVRE
jgi:uncharacterized RDD family membrane protein YckC